MAPPDFSGEVGSVSSDFSGEVDGATGIELSVNGASARDTLAAVGANPASGDERDSEGVEGQVLG